MKRALAAAALGLWLLCGAPHAQVAVEPEGQPDAGGVLRDRDFGVDTRQFGLDRRVEMYQWRRGDRGYEKVWNAAPIDSAGFEAGHDNPARLPLQNQRWWAPKPVLDGQPLDADVLRSLGEWRVLHPNLSRLPANMAASFQPEGEGLGSAENPLEPEIGDLRVTWRELVLPPLAGKVTLRDGAWRRVSVPNVVDPNPAESAPAREQGRTQRMWPVVGGALVAIVALVVAIRRKRERRRAGTAGSA